MDENDLRFDEVQVWAFSLYASESVERELAQLLTPDELARADRFVTQELRRRFIVCRGRLRQYLASILQIPAESVRFRYEAWGKPRLREIEVSPNGIPVHFNVSHSADLGVIAAAPCTVGVDIEVPNPRINPRAIASQIVSQREEASWKQLKPSERAEQTMRLWVCKEALLKGLGLGIAEGLLRTAFPIPISAGEAIAPEFIDPNLQMQLEEDASCARHQWLDPGVWRVHVFDDVAECFLALATLRQIRNVRLQIDYLRGS